MLQLTGRVLDNAPEPRPMAGVLVQLRRHQAGAAGNGRNPAKPLPMLVPTSMASLCLAVCNPMAGIVYCP